MKIPLLLSFVSGISTILGSILILIKFKNINKLIIISLSFSITIMILISLFDLIPNSLINIYKEYKIIYGTLISILVFLLGYLTINKINNKIKKNNSSLYNIGMLSMISLIIHNFPEGIAVFIGSLSNIKLGFKLCIAIMLHNIPEGIAISVPLYYSGISKRKTIYYTFLSGISEPLGALLSYIFLKKLINETFLSLILLFVSGLMISLALNDMLKEVLNYKDSKNTFKGIILGISLFIIILIM